MRCDICGTEYFGGDGVCPGCGYDPRTEARRTDAQSQGTVSQWRAASPKAVMNAYYKTSAHSPRQLKIAKLLIIVSTAAFSVIMIAVFVLTRIDFNYDFGSFTMDLPNSMREDSTSKFASYYMAHGADSAEYTNKNVRFAYVVFDGSGVQGQYDTSGSAAQAVLDSFSNVQDLEILSKSDDTVKFQMNSEGSLLYCQLRVTAEKEKLYYLLLSCYDSQRGRYEKKFDNYMASFKTK